MERERGEIGVFVCFENPTRPMLREAAEADFYRPSPLDKTTYPRIQILTIERLLGGRQPEYPKYSVDVTVRKSVKLARAAGQEESPAPTKQSRKPVASIRPETTLIKRAV
jgi:hypothetical protein